MSKARETLLKAADMFEKVAAYFEADETAQQEKRASELKSELLEPISEALGVQDPKMREKLASVDPDVLRFLKMSVVQNQSNDNMSLGGPSEKTASVEDEDPLLAFMQSPD